MSTSKETVLKIAERIREAGGRAMLVGGCVRDEIMGLEPKDFDIEVYHLSADELRSIVSEFGKVDAVGASFQVYKVGQDIDISLPRRERKTGVGHKGFTVEGDPNMTFTEACSRRDFTINAIMKDPLTGDIVDPYHGQVDIELRCLRAVSDKTFQEDSLRVLRLVQFASRLEFNISLFTYTLAKQTDLSDLPKERIWMELEKLFLKSKKLSRGIKLLFSLGIAEKLFPSFQVKGIVHSVIDRIDEKLTEGLSDGEKLAVCIALCTWSSELKVLEEFGLTSVAGYNVAKRVEELHMLPAFKFNTDYDYHKASQKVQMKLASKIFHAFDSPIAQKFDETIKRLGIEEEPVKPLVTGKYLIEYGMKPSPEMGQALHELYEEQLKGAVPAALWQLARFKAGYIEIPDE